MFRNLIIVFAVLVVFWLIAGPAQAQVVREQGTGSIAGVLQKVGGTWETNDFVFWSFGGEILVADLDAELFMIPGSEGGGCEDTTTEATEGGCTCGEDEGGSEGGQGQFTLAVLDGSGTAVCKVGRPKRPGWERDPRLACHLESAGNYTLQVGRGPMGEEPTSATAAAGSGPAKLVYLLNVSLRKVATSGPMIQSLTGGRNLFPRQN